MPLDKAGEVVKATENIITLAETARTAAEVRFQSRIKKLADMVMAQAAQDLKEQQAM